MTGTGTGAGAGTRMITDTRTEMGAGTGAGTRKRIERRVEKRESPEICGVTVKVGRGTRERGQRHRVTSSHSRKNRRPNETVTSYGGPELRDKRQGTGSGRVGDGRRSITIVGAM